MIQSATHSNLFLLVLQSKMNPRRVYRNALDMVQNHPQIQQRYGTPIQGFGILEKKPKENLSFKERAWEYLTMEERIVKPLTE